MQIVNFKGYPSTARFGQALSDKLGCVSGGYLTLCLPRNLLVNPHKISASLSRQGTVEACRH